MRRVSAERTTIQEVIETASEAYAQKVCLHPDPSSCKHGIIKAHSIQQNGGLSRIAVNGKVYGIRENNVGDMVKHGGLLEPKLVGIRKASTFTGMCGFHDHQTFAPIEKNAFESCPEHAYLLAYRHHCKEVFTKKAALAKLFPLLRNADAGEPFEKQLAIQDLINGYQEAFEKGLNNAETIKATYDSVLLGGDFSAVRYYVIRFNEVPDILCCSGTFPVFDFEGNPLQQLGDDRLPDHATFSIIATDSGGAVVFAWLGDCPSSERLVRTFHTIPDSEIGNAAVRHACEFCENIYLCPTWWDSLDSPTKLALRRRISAGADLAVERKHNCLMPDGLQYVNWSAAARESNLMPSREQ